MNQFVYDSHPCHHRPSRVQQLRLECGCRRRLGDPNACGRQRLGVRRHHRLFKQGGRVRSGAVLLQVWQSREVSDRLGFWILHLSRLPPSWLLPLAALDLSNAIRLGPLAELLGLVSFQLTNCSTVTPEH